MPDVPQHAGALHTWHTLNRSIMGLGEREVKALLDYEGGTRGRRRILMRLYHRYSRLRREREHSEITATVREL